MTLMALVPVLIIAVVLLVVTILLAIADGLLLSYGECKVTVRQEDEVKEFTVQGGGFLLSSLTEHNIQVTSSCAGKASCGYCKVRLQTGGGSILPTEEIFMSREESLSGMRLACQVKLKEDVEIHIPDLLSTVRTIVKNKTYDPKLRWRSFKTDGDGDGKAPEKPQIKLNRDERETLDEIFTDFRGTRGSAVPLLQRISGAFNYLPEPAMRYAARELHMPMSLLYRVATFYNAFSLEPKGRNIVKVCMGTACYVKGGEKILDTVRRKLRLGNGDGDTTKDMMFSVETVSCIGCCGQSPVMSVNEEIYGYLKPAMVDGIIDGHVAGAEHEKANA